MTTKTRETKQLVRLAREHYQFDLRIGNYIGKRGCAEYDAEYQKLASKEALRCARAGEGFLNSTERRWYDEYKKQNPV